MKKIMVSMLGILMYFIIFSHVEAAGTVSLSANKSSVYIGDTFNISVNLSGASVATLTTRLSIDTQKVEYVSGPSNSNYSNGKVIYTWTDPNGGASPITGGTIATFTFKAKSEGTSYFSISGDFYTPDETPVNPGFSGVGVTIKTVENNNENNNTNTNTNTNTGTNNNTNVNTNSSVSTPNQNTSSGGNNNTNTNKSSNNNLKTLQLNVEGINPSFNKNITQYYITVSESITNINVTAQPEDSKASVQVTGNTNLKNGLNQIKIIVTAENGNKKEYIINVTKTGNPELSNSNLENLAIENATLNPEFSPDVTDYTTEIYGDIDKLNILAVPQREAAQVAIEGNENLQYGENLIKITVLAEDGQTNKVYNINVLKKEEIIEEVVNEENQENGLSVIENIENRVKRNKWILFVILGGLVVVAISVIVIVYKKKNKK